MADTRAYFKTDVGYFDNPKLVDALEERPRVLILHLRAIAYCAQHLTDGVFPIARVVRLAAANWCGSECDSQCDVCEAVALELFEGYDGRNLTVHDYLEHQRSASQAKRLSSAAKSAAEARWSGAKSNAKRNADRNAEREEREKKKILSDSADAETRPDVEDLLDYLDAAIKKADPDARTPNRTKGNRDAARRLLDLDGRTPEQVKAAIDFATTDEFWAPNIRSMSKLRDKYDQLRAQAMRKRPATPQPRDTYAALKVVGQDG